MQSIIAQIKGIYNIDKFFLGALIVLLSLSSFSLGRLSKIFDDRPEFSFQNLPGLETNTLNPVVSTGTIVATKGGKKYYFVWCKAVVNLKEQNKIYFNSEDDAKRAGKTLANNCK